MSGEEQARIREVLERINEDAHNAEELLRYHDSDRELEATDAATDMEPAERDVINSRLALAEAEAKGVQIIFSVSGAGILALAASVAVPLWPVLNANVTASVPLLLAVVIALWLFAYGQVKARLIRAAAYHQLEIDLLKAKRKYVAHKPLGREFKHIETRIARLLEAPGLSTRYRADRPPLG